LESYSTFLRAKEMSFEDLDSDIRITDAIGMGEIIENL